MSERPSAIANGSRAGIASRYRRGSLAALLLPLAVALAAGGVYVARLVRPPRVSVAVLPLAAGGPDSAYLATALPESIAAALAQHPRLRVIAVTAIPRSLGAAPDPLSIGRALEVDTVVSGTVERRGDSVSLQVVASSTAAGDSWSAGGVRPLAEILPLHDDLAFELARRLASPSAALARETIGRRHSRDGVAFQLYLKGRHHLRTASATARRNAVAAFTQATAQDATFALAYAALAEALAAPAGAGGAAATLDGVAAAERAAARAVELEPELAEAHAALGLVRHHLLRDVRLAEDALRRAVAARHSYAAAHRWLGELLLEQGRLREAARELDRALALDPWSCAVHVDLARLALAKGDSAAAAQRYATALDLDDTCAGARDGLAHLGLESGAR